MDPLSRPANPRTTETDAPPTLSRLVLISSSAYLTESFSWAKRMALSKVHPDNGGCYQAALPDRGGYCQRDFVHQIDGAALLGLHRENLAMLRQFASHQTEARGWFTLWEINYDGSPMACDYRDDQHFWRNTAGMFDLIHGAYRQYLWTATPALVEDPVLHGLYSRTVDEFVAAHDRDGNGIVEGRAGTGWGIACTYNELPGIVLAESADSLGTQRRAFDAYARFLQARGDHAGAEGWAAKAERLRRIFNDTWYDVAASYRQEQDLARAEVRGTFTKSGVTVRMRSWMDAHTNLLLTELQCEGNEPVDVSVRAAAGASSDLPGRVADNDRPATVGRELHGGGRWYFDGELAGVIVTNAVLSGEVRAQPVTPERYDGKATWREWVVPRTSKAVSVAAWIKIAGTSKEANYIVSKGEWNQAYSLGLSNNRLRWAINGTFVQTAQAHQRRDVDDA